MTFPISERFRFFFKNIQPCYKFNNDAFVSREEAMRYHFLTRVEEKRMVNAGNITQDESLRRLDRFMMLLALQFRTTSNCLELLTLSQRSRTEMYCSQFQPCGCLKINVSVSYCWKATGQQMLLDDLFVTKGNV